MDKPEHTRPPKGDIPNEMRQTLCVMMLSVLQPLSVAGIARKIDVCR
jgi:hypothetical protein